MAAAEQRKFVDELRGEWKRLWKERYDDKEKAEGVAVDVYPKLFVDQGTIVHATRDFKALNFKEILEKHEVEPRNIQPHPAVGGWHKFAKTQIAVNKPKRRSESYEAPKKDQRQQPKKGGRGWLHSR